MTGSHYPRQGNRQGHSLGLQGLFQVLQHLVPRRTPLQIQEFQIQSSVFFMVFAPYVYLPELPAGQETIGFSPVPALSHVDPGIHL